MVQQNEAAVEDARRHNDIGVDGPERDAKAAGEHAAPAFRLAARVLVADEQRGARFCKESIERVGSAADNETNAARGSVFGRVAKALLEKVVVAQVGAADRNGPDRLRFLH